MNLIEDALPTKSYGAGYLLGAQLIAKTLGADAYSRNQKEIGWCDLHITPEAAQQSILKSLGCHGHSFPVAWRYFWYSRLARIISPHLLFVNQAFSYGDKIYGLQFTSKLIRR